MENPFRFSGVVSDPAFCNRRAELSDLHRYIGSSQNVLLYSHRRHGKSSLLLKLLAELESERSIYVDLYGTTGPHEFISAFLSGLSSLESRMERLIKLVRSRLMSIRVNFGIDSLTGLPTLSPVFEREVEERTIDELFALVAEFSKNERLVVVFDEFQEVAAYEDKVFEKRVRKAIQTHDRITYLFAGSQRHLLIEMFNNHKRAFYQLATGYPLGRIRTEHYVQWIRGLYRSSGREITTPMIEAVINLCSNHPRYIQEFFHEIWLANAVDLELIDRTERRILTRRVPEYAYIWDSLSLNQKKALKLLAGTLGKNIFSADNLSRFGFRAASQVTAALSTLEKAGVISKNTVWRIEDPFFNKWLQLRVSNIQLVR